MVNFPAPRPSGYNPVMSIFLPALGAAYAAICIWLVVRYFNRMVGTGLWYYVE
jgi:hypothetical protein